MSLSAGEQELKDGLALALSFLEARTGDEPLTAAELIELSTFKSGCYIHAWDILNCKYCDGVIIARTCQDGDPVEED